MRGAVPTEMSSTCIQGGVRPLGGYQPNVMMQPSSPNTAWQYHSLIPKQEPLDSGEKTDSGIHTGSDLSSSSPASDRSDNFTITDSPMSSQVMNTPMAPAYYSTPVIRNAQSGFQEQKFQSEQQPPIKQISEGNECFNFNACENPLKSLQMSMEKNGLLPGAMSPKHSEYSTDENKSDNDVDEYDEQGLRMPKVNSHGKVKQFKCKQCDFVAITKLDFWEHTKSHIKADKRLTCPKCPFVTEYKHHLEYHLRNHVGAKPFKCPQCRYSCVNKSMLNSHMKSHSNVYQYRCANCTYATKYCHSLKLHLRKYSHEPAMVLNPDGTPNPLPIIDVYGTRRGPKVKTANGVNNKLGERTSPPPTQMLPYPLTQLMLASPPQLQFGGFPLFPLPNPLLLQNLERLARESQGSLPPVPAQDESSSELNASPVHHTENENGVLDLSKHDTPTTQQSRRKGRAFKFTQAEDNSSEDEEEGTTTMFSNVEVVEHNPEKEKEDPAVSTNNNNNEKYRCEYCDITFGDQVLHSIHMGYHGFNNPFTCNGCGEELKDKVEFYIHVVRKPHT